MGKSGAGGAFPLSWVGLNWGGSNTTAASKMELFVIIVSGFQQLTIITKSSILDVAAVLDPLWVKDVNNYYIHFKAK